MIKTEIIPPFPKVLILNFNWVDPDSLSTRDLFKVFRSFSDHLTLHDFYHVNSKRYPEENTLTYSISSFICFVGAHYLIFIGEKEKEGNYSNAWRLINDTSVNQTFKEWGEVVDFCISSKCIPTLVFCEEHSIPPSNQQSTGDERYQISGEILEMLNLKAVDQDEYMNSLYNDEALLEEQKRIFEELQMKSPQKEETPRQQPKLEEKKSSDYGSIASINKENSSKVITPTSP